MKKIGLLLIEKIFLQFPGQQRLLESLQVLNANEDYKEYVSRKIKRLVVGSCLVLLLFVCIRNSSQKEILLNNTILRNSYNETEKEVILYAFSEGMEEKIQLSVEPMHYAKDELDKMAQKVFEYLEREVLFGEDSGENCIYGNLILPNQLENFPFSIAWESSNYEVLDNDGQIMKAVPEDGQEVILTARLTCYEYLWEKEYLLKVHPENMDWKEEFASKVVEEIEMVDVATQEQEQLVLPSEIEGHKIEYVGKEQNLEYVILVIGFVCIFLLSKLMDNQIIQQMKAREEQLLCDYAKLVSKLSLYLQTGLSLRSSLIRIHKNGDKTRFYIRELEKVIHELDNGIPEDLALEHFGKRCKLPCYTKLCVLINQNLKKGNNQLCEQLKVESRKAFEERKNIARKYGEEVGTKILFPMLLMLVVVMVIIMYPAFVSFTV